MSIALVTGRVVIVWRAAGGCSCSVSVLENLNEAPMWMMAHAHMCLQGGTWTYTEEPSSLDTLVATEINSLRDWGT